MTAAATSDDAIAGSWVRPWLAITAASLMFFGVWALLAPASLGDLYGGETNDSGLLWGRYYGSATAFAGLVAAFAFGSRSIETVRFVTAALLALFTANLGVSLFAVGEEILNAFHWTTIAFQAVMVAVWGYYRLYALRTGQPPAGD
jgi:hypothetical protein